MIDTSKCFWCRKGIWPFVTDKDTGRLQHLDFFATPEAGAIVFCENEEQVKPLLVEDKKRGVWEPVENFKIFLDQQSYWWEDLISLANTVFDKDHKAISELFQNKEHDLIHKSDAEMEAPLVELAKQKGIDVTEYVDLICNRKKDEQQGGNN